MSVEKKALQGGSVLRGRMRGESRMTVCCSGGTRPVIYKIERMDIKDGAQPKA